MNRHRMTLCAAVLAMAVSGCNRDAPADTGAGTAAAPSTDTNTGAKAGTVDDAWHGKVQAYIKIGNTLRKFSSPVNETFAKWAAEARAKVEAGDFKEIASSGTFSDSAVASLKEATAMRGKTPDLDRAATALASALDEGLPNWRELEEYNTAKRYEDDDGAKGKALLPKYRETLAKVDASLASLEQHLDAAARISHDKALAEFKKDGKLLEMHTWEATGAAEKVLALFDGEDDFKDAAKIKQADAQISAMETSITAMRAEHAKREAKADSLPNPDRYDSIASNLIELAGHYREARKDPSSINDAVDDYNDAIDDLNMMNH